VRVLLIGSAERLWGSIAYKSIMAIKKVFGHNAHMVAPERNQQGLKRLGACYTAEIQQRKSDPSAMAMQYYPSPTQKAWPH